MPLSERDRAILDFERSWWTEPGPKESAIRSRLGLSATRYYQLVAALVDSREAAAYDRLVILRLRRDRARRRRARIEGPVSASALRGRPPRAAVESFSLPAPSLGPPARGFERRGR